MKKFLALTLAAVFAVTMTAPALAMSDPLDPAAAQHQTAPVKHHKAKHVHKVAYSDWPAPKPTPKPVVPTPAPKKDTVDPVAYLKTFTEADLQNAVALAKNDIVTLPCWTFLLGIVNGTIPNVLPNQLGAATAVQVAFNDEALLASYFAPGGLFDQFGVACAPMINKINVQVVAGGTAIASGLVGGPGGSAAVFAGLQAILGGAIAIPKL